MHLPIALTYILQQIDILVPIENTLFGGPFVIVNHFIVSKHFMFCKVIYPTNNVVMDNAIFAYAKYVSW